MIGTVGRSGELAQIAVGGPEKRYEGRTTMRHTVILLSLLSIETMSGCNNTERLDQQEASGLNRESRNLTVIGIKEDWRKKRHNKFGTLRWPLYMTAVLRLA